MSRTIDAMKAAEDRALAWDIPTLRAIKDSKPARYRHVTDWAWVVTVAMAQKDEETPKDSAQRLCHYVTLYQERNGAPPSISGLREEVAQ